MTYGQLKLRLTQAFPGVSLDILEGFCNDRYQEILGELPWSHENIQAVLQTRAPYTAGTVAVTAGSNVITLTGGTWDSTMNSLTFRVKGNSDFYEFTYTSATSGILDRPYDGATATAAAYSISQTIYVLPSNCQLLADDAFSSRLGPMTRFTHEQINAFDPTRSMTGVPTAWAGYMESIHSIPPLMQVEVWPTPSDTESLFYTYQSFAPDLQAEAALLQIWMSPTALVEGITSRLKAHLRDYAGAAFHAAQADKALKQMRASEAEGLALGQMGLPQYYVGYRSKRWSR